MAEILEQGWIAWFSADGMTPASYAANTQVPNDVIPTVSKNIVTGGTVSVVAGGLPKNYMDFTSSGYLIKSSGLGSNAFTFPGNIPFSFHVAVRISTHTVKRVIEKRAVSTQMEYDLNISTTEQVGFSVYSGGAIANFRTWTTTAGTIPLNVWTFIGVSYDGTNTAIYINGSPVAATPTTGGSWTGIVTGTSQMTFGQVAGTVNFLSHADNIGIRDRVTTQAEFAALYNGGAGLNPFSQNGKAMHYFMGI